MPAGLGPGTRRANREKCLLEDIQLSLSPGQEVAGSRADGHVAIGRAVLGRMTRLVSLPCSRLPPTNDPDTHPGLWGLLSCPLPPPPFFKSH